MKRVVMVTGCFFIIISLSTCAFLREVVEPADVAALLKESKGDTVPPVVKITSHTNGQEVGGSYQLTGSVSDEGGSGVDKVYVSTDGGNDVAVVPLNGIWTIDFTELAFGTHTHTVYAEDKANNRSAEVSVSVVNIGLPWIVIASPANGTILTNTTNIILTGTADVDAPYVVTAVQIDLNGGGWTNATGTNSWSANLTLVEGSNLIHVRAIADSGGTNISSEWLIRSQIFKWREVGSPGFSAGQAGYVSLAFAPDGAPYVAYEDYGNDNKATVMKFDGSSWTNVGSPGFSVSNAMYISLAFDSGGTPYVAYEDVENYNRVTAMKFDGSAWTNVGSPGFSAGAAFYLSLAFAPDGAPYVAYRDGSTAEYKATVMKFDGSSWTNVGSPRFSAGGVYYTSLAFDSGGTPYVAYGDGASSSYATVMKFDGSVWTNVGSSGFSAGSVYYTSLAFAPDGAPYVAYQDLENGYRATVMKFDGSAWTNVGSAGFSTGIVYYTSLAFGPDGTPYLAYRDGGNGEKATVMRYSYY